MKASGENHMKEVPLVTLCSFVAKLGKWYCSAKNKNKIKKEREIVQHSFMRRLK